MKTLIAVSSHRAFESGEENDAIRETWMGETLPPGFDAKIFVGRGDTEVKPETVVLDCGDEYEQMTFKTLGKLQWAIERDYDFIFCACSDTYVRPERLVACGFEHYDCMGAFLTVRSSPKFINGGAGYLLSARAAKIVLTGQKPATPEARCFEDGFVTARLKDRSDLRLGGDYNLFAIQGTGPRAWNRAITKHLHFRFYHEINYHAQLMRDEHRTWLDSLAARMPQKRKPWWSFASH
jgi:Galactosyltransferase